MQDEKFEAQAVVRSNILRLDQQPPDVASALHLDDIQDDTLHHYRVNTDEWHRVALNTAVQVNGARVRFRALTKETVKQPFPLVFCSDMSFGFSVYHRHHDYDHMPRVQAFELAFPQCAPTASNIEALALCRTLWNTAPEEMKTRYEDAGHALHGRWARFVDEASATGQEDPFASTPTATHRRRERSPSHADDTQGGSARKRARKG